MTHDILPIGRRGLLGLASAGLVAAIPWRLASAETTDDSAPTVPVQQLDGALLAVMKAGRSQPFAQRYRALVPVIEQVFNLEAVLATSIGLSWATLAGSAEGLAGDGVPPLHGFELRRELRQL